MYQEASVTALALGGTFALVGYILCQTEDPNVVFDPSRAIQPFSTRSFLKGVGISSRWLATEFWRPDPLRWGISFAMLAVHVALMMEWMSLEELAIGAPTIASHKFALFPHLVHWLASYPSWINQLYHQVLLHFVLAALRFAVHDIWRAVGCTIYAIGINAIVQPHVLSMYYEDPAFFFGPGPFLTTLALLVCCCDPKIYTEGLPAPLRVPFPFELRYPLLEALVVFAGSTPRELPVLMTSSLLGFILALSQPHNVTALQNKYRDPWLRNLVLWDAGTFFLMLISPFSSHSFFRPWPFGAPRMLAYIHGASPIIAISFAFLFLTFFPLRSFTIVSQRGTPSSCLGFALLLNIFACMTSGFWHKPAIGFYCALFLLHRLFFQRVGHNGWMFE